MAVTTQSYGTEIEELVSRIVSRFRPLRVILFGSRARGTGQPDSDADILVVMPVKGSRREAATEIDIALIGIKLPVDIIVATPEDIARSGDMFGTVIHEALEEGKVLYDQRG